MTTHLQSPWSHSLFQGGLSSRAWHLGATGRTPKGRMQAVGWQAGACTSCACWLQWPTARRRPRCSPLLACCTRAACPRTGALSALRLARAATCAPRTKRWCRTRLRARSSAPARVRACPYCPPPPRPLLALTAPGGLPPLSARWRPHLSLLAGCSTRVWRALGGTCCLRMMPPSHGRSAKAGPLRARCAPQPCSWAPTRM
mmetsp:Transcript_8058/g.20151  ORF Transcript_8058/g.20151 Transcript_8058/m.20151 type:complete len:201 (-) Transcript_8058:1684-2286(-)